MTPREAHHNSHAQARPAAACFSLTHVDPRNRTRQLKSSYLRHHAGRLFRNGTCAPSAMRCSSARAVRSKSSSVPVALWGLCSCVHHRGRRTRAPRKPSVRIGGRPTDLSVMLFQKSASASFGPKTRRHISLQPLRNSAARPARHELQNDISAAIAIGRAMRRPRSLPKFSSVKECATSA